MTNVFISYSHDSDDHKACVLALSNCLIRNGIDCDIDQYNPAPEQGWPRWMMQGIQQADYVLLVCTETYRKRLELEEEQGKGLGVKWEGSLIFNILYRNETFNSKFIPLVFDTENKAHIPDILFGYDYHDLSQPRGYDHLYRHIRGTLGAEKPPLGKARYTRTIYSNSLPTVEGKLFGRKDELALLDKAWADPQTHVVQFVASGGTGKTKLLKHWLDTNTDSIEALIAWSFYSQGSSEDKQVSATPFFSHVFGVLKSEKTQFNTEEEKGEHLAHLLRQRRCLLVLDGLEPLQHAGRGMRGELKDRAIRQLLKSLAGEHNSLCIITTRLAVHELSDRAHVISHDLQNLAPDDGVSLLKSWEVHGSDTELEKAVHEYGCHALALHLLGNALHTYLDGDVRKRDTLSELIDDYDDAGRHAFKVMQAYSRWLAGTPELQLLHLLGLFDHPIETDVLQVLWKAQIANLTAGIPEKAWKVAIRDLREKHRMLSAHEGRPDLLDCHPLIREYFGGQLQTQQPQAWQQAHERLYEYYKALPEKLYGKFLPETLEEMQPLFSAVAHGCAAKLYEQARTDVYLPSIRRYDENYLCIKLGAFNDDLSLAANFFLAPWKEFYPDINHRLIAEISNWAGFSLSTIGRLREALETTETSLKYAILLKDWETACQNAINLSQFQLMTGNIKESIIFAEEAISHAKKSGVKSKILISTSILAHSNYEAGNIQKALYCLRKAEKIQKEFQPDTPRLYSFGSFVFCDVLLSTGQLDEAIERAQYGLSIAIKHNWLPDIALGFLSYAHSFLYKKKFHESLNMINSSIDKLKYSQQQTYLPNALLVRTALYRKTHAFTFAHHDLEEVFDIANSSGMRLHLTDYHLEMARLLVAEEEFGEAREQVAKAAKLITETGYKRRLPELEALQQQLA